MPRFSATLLDHARQPRNGGGLTDPNAVGHASLSGRAPYTTIYLKIEEGAIKEASFKAFGCGVTIAACSALTQLLRNKLLRDCSQLTAADVVDSLDGIPADKAFCADLAVSALGNAIEGYNSP